MNLTAVGTVVLDRAGIIIEADDIDRLNILRATQYAMQYAVENLAKTPDVLVIDALTLSSVSIKQLSYVRGESVSASIAAASIIAKVTRDRIMSDYHRQFPQYNFQKHKGYSTREHLDLLRVYGPCPIHRKTFYRVMTLDLPF